MTDHLPGRFDGLPRRHPAPDILELLELELDGALPAGYFGSPQALGLSDEATAVLTDGGGLVLEDAEGTPVAAYLVDEEPALVALRPFTHGPLRRHRRSPADVRDELGVGDEPVSERRILGVVVTEPFGASTVEFIKASAEQSGHRVLWLVVVGSNRNSELSPDGLLRAVRALHEELGLQGVVVPVAIPGNAPDAWLTSDVATAYGSRGTFEPLYAENDPRRPAGDPFRDPDDPPHPAFAREIARQQSPAHARGVTVFFTGLSGSGKSTVAKALAERIVEDSTRTVTLLDGDEVRRLLSAGLTFSREDRDLNIRRIGYVATEISRHGGVAICAPIAPFDIVRREVRRGVEAVGDFILVHVSTPLEECERRDRKGLYAKARRGEIPDFTGISSPYETPDDAELRLDTTGRAIDDCVDEVWALLDGCGYLG